MAPKVPTATPPPVTNCITSPKTVDKHAKVGGTVTESKEVSGDGIQGTAAFPFKGSSNSRPAS